MGIHSPEGAGPELIVEGEKKGKDLKGETYYGSNSGVLVGDDTRHGTRECDHRSKHEVRITTSIYLADATKENIGILAGDTTSIFPPMEEMGEEWIWYVLFCSSAFVVCIISIISQHYLGIMKGSTRTTLA